MANVHALLVAVDRYLPNRLPDGSYYPDLHGCVRDIEAVDRFLRERAGVDPARITKLTASHGSGKAPAEPKARWPTYENIVAAWKRIAAAAAPGDQVYVHYSGHGGRSTTIFPELKGKTGLDESLVPTDIGNSEARYVRDVEIACLLAGMVEKGLLVTVVLDSCHSGGATRAGRPRVPDVAVRGIASIDTTERPQESDVAPVEELAATWKQQGAATRNLAGGAGWLLEPRGYVLLAACRAQESAYEYAIHGERHGALTWWLLDALRQLGPGLTWRAVHQRVLASVHGVFAEQTPQLQGEGDRAVLGADQVKGGAAAVVLEVKGDRLRVGLGQAHGLRAGATIAIEGPGDDERLAIAEIEELGAAESWALVVKRAGRGAIGPGARAVPLDPGDLKLRRGVRLLREDGPAAFWEALARGLREETGFARLAGDGEAADFHVTVEDGEARICDAAATVLPNVRPPIEATSADAAPRVLSRLDHLARHANVRALDNRDPMSPLARKLVVELAGSQERYDPVDPAQPVPFTDPGSTPDVQVGSWIFLRVRNASRRVLNVTILDLQPDWGISKVYPARAGAFEPLDPGAELLLPFRTNLPDGTGAGRDVLKVLATVDTTDFGALELPSLDEPPRRVLRNLTAAGSPSHDWVAAQVEVNVVR